MNPVSFTLFLVLSAAAAGSFLLFNGASLLALGLSARQPATA